MTKEEAIAYGERVIDLGLNDETQTFCQMALKALEQEPCEDAINRAEAIKALEYEFSIEVDNGLYKYRTAIKDVLGAIYDMQKKAIEDLPSIQPIRPKGEWIPVSERLPEMYDDVLICSEDGWIEVAHRWGTGDEFIDNDGASWTINEGNDDDVLAWMPLPEPYKVESEVDKECSE